MLESRRRRSTKPENRPLKPTHPLARGLMALTLQNEFVVAAPIEPTWRLLLDLGRVAKCLPGATIDPDLHAVFPGTMRIKLGPVTMNYHGTARIREVDAHRHTAIFDVEGREVRGAVPQRRQSATASSTTRVRRGCSWKPN